MPGISKFQLCTVKLLDGEEYSLQLNVETSYGVELYDKVCESLELTEKDYFSLRYVHPKDKMYSWLNFRKTLKDQLKEGPYMFYFFVKYFPPDPCTLQEDLTRYLFVLAIRDLIYFGRLNCSPHYQLMLCSYIIQAEFGDYSEELVNKKYLDGLKFMPNQQSNFNTELIEYHKKNMGLTPEEVEIQYLKYVKDLPLYGVELHDVKDHEFKDFILGVSSRGLHIYSKECELMKIFWQELTSASFFKKSITIKTSLVNKGSKQLKYKCSTRGATKRLYRAIVDFHTFFRRPLPLPPIAGLKLSSRFRYNGRKTYLQIQNSIPSSTSKTIFPIDKKSVEKVEYIDRIPVYKSQYQSNNDVSEESDTSEEYEQEQKVIQPLYHQEYECQYFELKFDEYGCRIANSLVSNCSFKQERVEHIMNKSHIFIPNNSYVV